MKIRVKQLNVQASLPVIKHNGDAGADLYYCGENSICLYSGRNELVPTGIAIEIPYGYVGLVHPRSGMATHGVTVVNAPGTIDAGYRGEIMVNLIKLTGGTYKISPGDRIAQLLVQKVEQPLYVYVTELSESARGISGHGSTGV